MPFREYTLPLKRERWRAWRDGEGATCPGGFALLRMTSGNAFRYSDTTNKKIKRKFSKNY